MGAGISFSAALFEAIRFYASPSANALSFQNEVTWLSYAYWRANLLPTSLSFSVVAFVMLLLSIAVYPLAQRYRRVFTVSIVAFLQEQLLVWGSWLDRLGSGFFPWLWHYDPFPILYLVTGESVAISVLFLACTALITVQISFRSFPKTIQVISLSLVPLPIYVYVFDRGEFYIHFQSAVSSLSFITNQDLLAGCIAVFCLSSLYQTLPWLWHSVLTKNGKAHPA